MTTSTPPAGDSIVGPLVAPEGAADADASRPPTLRRPLDKLFPEIQREREPGEAGGVPLPKAWECFAAVIGGASRPDLEAAHAERVTDEARMAAERVGRAIHYGRYLPAGLHIVTGQTGGAKSALVTNLGHAAIYAGHPVLYVSLELDGRELAARVVGLHAGLPWSVLARGWHLTEDQRTRRDAAIVELGAVAGRFETWIPDGIAMDPVMLRRDVLALWREHRRSPLVIVDYLQLAGVRTADGFQPPLRERIAVVTMELRRLSRVAESDDWPGCPIVVLSTTARGNVRGEGAIPGLDGVHPDKIRHADLETLKALPKEAGEIENTSVTAWVVALGEREGADGARRLALRLAKNRLGPPGQWLPFRFHGTSGRLEEEPGRFASTPDEERAEAEGTGRAREDRRQSAPPRAGGLIRGKGANAEG